MFKTTIYICAFAVLFSLVQAFYPKEIENLADKIQQYNPITMIYEAIDFVDNLQVY